MSSINQVIKAFLTLIEVGGVFRIIMIFLNIMEEPDSKDQNVKRIRHVIVFMILAAMIYGLKDIVLTYYQ